MFEAPSRAIQGQIDRVAALVAETDAHQAALSMPVMQPYALVWGAVPLFYAGDPDAAKARLQRGIEVATAQGAVFWQFIGQAWAQVMDPDLAQDDAGIARFGQVIDTLRAIGATVGVPYFSAVHSSRFAAAGRHTEALSLSSRAVAETQAEGLFCWYPEILRLHARNCRVAGRAADADAALAKAIEVARDQGAALWLLHAILDRVAGGGSVEGLDKVAASFPDSARFPALEEARSRVALL
jgi:hypothetical protein